MKSTIPAERGNYAMRYALHAECAEGAPRQTVTIHAVPGDAAPYADGDEGGYWLSESGLTVVSHPSAYAAAGGRPQYVRSRRRLTVGDEWVQALGELDQWDDEGRTVVSMSPRLVVRQGTIGARVAWHEHQRCWYVRDSRTGQTYHAPRHCDAARPDRHEGLAAIRLARAALARQAEISALGGVDAYLEARGDSLWVTREHSILAGHCHSGTEASATQIEQALGAEGPVGAVTARALIELRGQADPFARRAIAMAAK